MTFVANHDYSCSSRLGGTCDCSVALPFPVQAVVESTCNHEWDTIQFESVTLIPKKRKCSKCGIAQTSTLIWTTNKDE